MEAELKLRKDLSHGPLTVEGVTCPSFYSIKAIQTVLLAYGVSQGLKTNLSHYFIGNPGLAKDPVQHSGLPRADFYFYPSQPLSAFSADALLKDTSGYFLFKKTDSKSRNVCYLFEESGKPPLALVLQWTEVNTKQTQGLTQLCATKQYTTVEDVRTFPQIDEAFKRLYGRMNCLVIGRPEDQDLAQRFKPAIETAFAGLSVKLDFLVTQNYASEFTESIYLFLTAADAEIEKIEAEAAFLKHQQICRVWLMDILKDIGITPKPNTSEKYFSHVGWDVLIDILNCPRQSTGDQAAFLSKLTRIQEEHQEKLQLLLRTHQDPMDFKMGSIPSSENSLADDNKDDIDSNSNSSASMHPSDSSVSSERGDSINSHHSDSSMESRDEGVERAKAQDQDVVVLATEQEKDEHESAITEVANASEPRHVPCIFEEIRVILLACGVAEGLQAKLSHSVIRPVGIESPATQLDFYFYSLPSWADLTADLLMKDTIHYFFHKGTKPNARKVCYLIKTGNDTTLAFVVESSLPNSQQVQKLNTFLEQRNLKTVEAVEADDKAIVEFRTLYHERSPKCFIIGSSQNQTLQQTFKPLIHAITAQRRIPLEFFEPPLAHRQTIFVEMVYLILVGFQPKLADISPEDTATKHRTACRLLLKLKLKSVVGSGSPGSEKIAENLTHLAKYNSLAVERAKRLKTLEKDLNAKYSSMGLENDEKRKILEKDLNLDNFEVFLENDQKLKLLISKRNEDVDSYINTLAWPFLIELLQIQGTQPLLEKLIAMKKTCYEAMKAQEKIWEYQLKDFKQALSWKASLWRKTKQLAFSVYRKTSFTHMGAELYDSVGAWFFPKMKENKKAKAALRFAGASLGGAVGVVLGVNRVISTTLMLTLHHGTHRITTWWEGDGIDHQRREFILSRKKHITPFAVIPIFELMISGIMGVYTQQFAPVIKGLCAIIGSYTLGGLARMLPGLRGSPTEYTENQVSAISLFMMMGGHLGYASAHLKYKLDAAQHVLSEFAKGSAPLQPATIAVDFPNLLLSSGEIDFQSLLRRPGSWLFDEDTRARLTWQYYPGQYVESECRVFQQGTLVACKAPVAVGYLPLTR